MNSNLTPSSKGAQSGYTLLELMISITLSLFIITGALMLYQNSRNAFQGQERVGRLMENGRIAAELMNQSIRQARYWGCAGVDDDDVTINIAANSKSERGIYGIENALGTPDSITVYKALDETTKIIAIDPAIVAGGGIIPGHISQANGVWVEEDSGFIANDYIVVNNCRKADVFKVASVTTNVGKPDHLNLLAWNCPAAPAICTMGYGINAEILKIERSTFSISSNQLRVNINGTNNTLIANVQDMQILYGYDNDDDNNVDQYISASTVNAHCVVPIVNNNCWRSITSVRISLLLRTEDNVTQAGNIYYFYGAPRNAVNDHRLRREFMTVVSLRNHRA